MWCVLWVRRTCDIEQLVWFDCTLNPRVGHLEIACRTVALCTVRVLWLHTTSHHRTPTPCPCKNDIKWQTQCVKQGPCSAGRCVRYETLVLRMHTFDTPIFIKLNIYSWNEWNEWERKEHHLQGGNFLCLFFFFLFADFAQRTMFRFATPDINSTANTAVLLWVYATVYSAWWLHFHVLQHSISFFFHIQNSRRVQYSSDEYIFHSKE